MTSKCSLIFLIFVCIYFIFSVRTSNYLRLKKEYEKILEQYKYDNCYMEVFSKLNIDCENLTDELINSASYKLTICSLEKLEVQIPKCNFETEPNECIKSLRGDLWTTFSSFTTQISNVCFYFNFEKWEKSFDALFNSIVKSSESVLQTINKSSEISNKIMTSHKFFLNDLNKNFTNTLSFFKEMEILIDKYNNSQEIFDKAIKKFKKEMNINAQMTFDFNILFYKNIDLLGTFKFYFTMLIILILLMPFINLKSLYVFYVIFIFIEILLRNTIAKSYYYYPMILYFRIGYYFLISYIVAYNHKIKHKKFKRFSKRRNYCKLEKLFIKNKA